ncbi:MAG: cupredoxin domain-containing protein [Chloroflexi bacterium]|nr:cupredoxin domain-containing protein [Chloroflexota bacterium]
MSRLELRWARGIRIGAVLLASLGIVLAGLPPVAAQTSSDILAPDGYQVTQYASGFTSTTAFDRAPNGDLYVVDSGANFGYPPGAQLPSVKIWKVSNGNPSLIYNGDAQKGLTAPALGIAVKDPDTIFVNDYSGLNRVHADGSVQHLLDLPAKGDHGDDHIAIGKDNKLYWGEGSATNSGVVGEDNQSVTGWLKNNPSFHDIACKDVTLSGQNWTSKDVLGGSDNTVTTGPFLPFGTAATAGQVIKGAVPCTSSVMRANMDGSGLEMVAWGFRNPYGIGFAPDDSPLKGSLIVANNGADVRGSRPIESDGDDLYAVVPGGWYGWPDILDEQPTTEPRFAPSDPNKAGVPMALQSPTQQDALSALTHFQKGVSADGFAFSTSDTFGWKGDLFIAEWGALGFGLQPPHGLPGFDVIRVNFDANPQGIVVGANKSIFLTNKIQGAASTNGLNGFEHPIDVRFSADGATMYVLDYGIGGKPGTGKVWAVKRTGNGAPGGTAPSNAAAPPPTQGPAPAGAPPAAAPASATATPAPTAVPTLAAVPAVAASGTANVTVANFAYEPQTLTVTPGTTVTWTNTDTVQHTVTWDDRSVDSGLFGLDQTFSYTFTQPGTYGYFCIPHGSPGAGMYGTVIVSNG